MPSLVIEEVHITEGTKSEEKLLLGPLRTNYKEKRIRRRVTWKIVQICSIVSADCII